MIVKELIELLQTMPQDAEVIHTFCSTYDVLHPDYVQLFKAEDKHIYFRHGKYWDYCERYWPKDQIPEFVTVVHFKGN